jgi:hypothetical protein
MIVEAMVKILALETAALLTESGYAGKDEGVFGGEW